jgi:hypothetical protein
LYDKNNSNNVDENINAIVDSLAKIKKNVKSKKVMLRIDDLVKKINYLKANNKNIDELKKFVILSAYTELYPHYNVLSSNTKNKKEAIKTFKESFMYKNGNYRLSVYFEKDVNINNIYNKLKKFDKDIKIEHLA